MHADAITSDLLRPLGNTGLRCCPVGFGCYRIVEGNPAHEAALRAYLDRGGNLIDTSANYGDGRAEDLVGRVLRIIPATRSSWSQREATSRGRT